MSMYVYLAIGFVIGVLAANILRVIQTASGTLKIDKSNPDTDVYRLEINGDLSKISSKKTLMLSIDSNADLTQK